MLCLKEAQFVRQHDASPEELTRKNAAAIDPVAHPPVRKLVATHIYGIRKGLKIPSPAAPEAGGMSQPQPKRVLLQAFENKADALFPPTRGPHLCGWAKMLALLHFFSPVLPQWSWKRRSKRGPGPNPEHGTQFGFVNHTSDSPETAVNDASELRDSVRIKFIVSHFQTRGEK